MYKLGLDIGIASVGFAGIEKAEKTITFAGVRVFDAAEKPKNKGSLAAERRGFRSQRRTIHRRASRKNAIKKLFLQRGLEVSAIGVSNPWNLRKEALERLLDHKELATALFHIAKRRGYQSNSKKQEAGDKENTKALGGIKTLQGEKEAAEAETIGAYLATCDKKRNREGHYERTVKRDDLGDEVELIFEKQRIFGNTKATEKLQEKFQDLAFTQRPLKSSSGLVGQCTFFPKERRAPKCSPTAELFALWGKLNNLKVKNKPISSDKKKQLYEKCLKDKTGVTFTAAAKILDCEVHHINFYRKNDKPTKIFVTLKNRHILKEALLKAGMTEADFESLYYSAKRGRLDHAAAILSFEHDDKKILKKLKNIGFHEEAEELSHITSFSGTLHLSLKCIRKILPFMEEGDLYNEACEKAGFHHSKKAKGSEDLLPPYEGFIPNPVVGRSIAQLIKVVNACIRKHGKPESIFIELSREVGKSAKARSDIEKEQKKNEEERETAKNHIRELEGREPKGEDILRYRLWKDQEQRCALSFKYIEPQKVCDGAITEVHHILPKSRTFDNSYQNKVLVFKTENQDAGNDIPYAYFQRIDRDVADLEDMANHLPKWQQKKKRHLLMEELTEEEENEFKSRNLNDTRYIAREIKSFIESHLKLGPENENRVQVRNGALTAELRGRWGLGKKHRDNNLHHAMDAIIVASSTQEMVQKFTNWNKYDKYKEQGKFIPKAWDSFREDAIEAVEKVFVSRARRCKITGAAHEETVRSLRPRRTQHLRLCKVTSDKLEKLVDKKGDNEELYQLLKERLKKAHHQNPKEAFSEPVFLHNKCVTHIEIEEHPERIVQRIVLSKVKKGDLEKMVDKERNAALYNVLKERLDSPPVKNEKGKEKHPFSSPVYMPRKDGSNGPEIKHIRIITEEKEDGLKINGGIVSRGEMIRTDVFFCEEDVRDEKGKKVFKKGGYYLVPIYAHHSAGKNPSLPNKVIKSGEERERLASNR